MRRGFNIFCFFIKDVLNEEKRINAIKNKGGHMETAIIRISLIGGIISFIILSSLAASIISGLAALAVTGCVNVAKKVVESLAGGE